MDIKLSTCQETTVDEFVQFLISPTDKELVIEGHSGTGKTTLVNYLLRNLQKFEETAKAVGTSINLPNNIHLTATTHKAANELHKKLDKEVKTIHSFLGLRVINNYATGTTSLIKQRDAQVKHDMLLFIDEASYIDEILLNHIRDLTSNCKIVYLGDPYQLLSVNADESPVFDKDIKTAKLTTVMRHDGDIYNLSTQWRNTVHTGEFKPIVVPKGSTQIERLNGMDFQTAVDTTFTDPKFKADDTAKILCWRNDTVNDYNNYVHNIKGYTDDYTPGESLIVNSPVTLGKAIVANSGEVLKVTEVHPAESFGYQGYELIFEGLALFTPKNKYDRSRALKKFYKQGKESGSYTDYFYIKDSWVDLRPPYASTVHKAQGSTFDIAMIDLNDLGDCREPDTVARLLYVGISRASKKVILYGNLPSKYTGAVDHVMGKLLPEQA